MIRAEIVPHSFEKGVPMDFSINIIRKKIKNMYLRVHPDGSVTVTAPGSLSDKKIAEFINSKSDWILAQQEKMRKRQNTANAQGQEPSFVTGEVQYLWGQPSTLLVEDALGRDSVSLAENSESGNSKAMENAVGNLIVGTIIMRTSKESTVEQRGKLLEEFYRRQLNVVIPPLMEKYVQVVGKAPSEWRIRSMKTRWGSCSVKTGRIRLALNLAKKPLQCLEYVIVHELTHLHVPNHSKAFWARMDKYFPEWKAVRKLMNER